MSKYKLAIVCGRFQPIHNGHVAIIRRALSCANIVGLYIGSSNNTGTKTNPVSYIKRLQLIYKVFSTEIDNGRLIVKPLYDREHPADDLSWGKYYLDCIHKDFGYPDLFVYGDDKVRSQWFTDEDLIGIDQLTITRATNPISATEIRARIDDFEFFKQNTPEKIWTDYEKIKEKINEVNR